MMSRSTIQLQSISTTSLTMLHTLFMLFAAVLVTLLWSSEATADQATYDTYPPGTFQLTPWTMVQLQPVPVTIPDQLGHMPKNLRTISPQSLITILRPGTHLFPRTDG